MKHGIKYAVLALSAVVMLQGCTTRLSSGQEQELDAYEKKGLLVKEKSPALAAVLGIFPMAGYIYTGLFNKLDPWVESLNNQSLTKKG